MVFWDSPVNVSSDLWGLWEFKEFPAPWLLWESFSSHLSDDCFSDLWSFALCIYVFVFNKELKGSLELIYCMLTTNTQLHSVLLPQPTDSLKLLCLIYFFPPSLHILEIESRGKARQLNDSSCFLSLGITILWCVIFNVWKLYFHMSALFFIARGKTLIPETQSCSEAKFHRPIIYL